MNLPESVGGGGRNQERALRSVFLRVTPVVLVIVLSVLGAFFLLRYFPPQIMATLRHDVWFEGELPAPRGRLLDRGGAPLAWSTRHFSLYWRVPLDVRERREALAIVRMSVSGVTLDEAAAATSAGREVMLRETLSGTEVLAVSRLRTELGGLEVRSYTVRHHAGVAALAALLGAVQVSDGRERGISGAERTHDTVLAGRPGRFQVMIDRQGKWKPETWRKTAEVCPGNDVYLPVTIPR